jgi:streptogramin lyase
VYRYPTGSTIVSLFSAAGGSDVWFAVHGPFDHGAGHATADGRVSLVSIPNARGLGSTFGQVATVGPDGQAWFADIHFGERGRSTGTLFRVNVDGSAVGIASPANTFVTGMAAGSDGTLWLTGGATLSRVRIDGSVFASELNLPPCADPIAGNGFSDVTRASDGAMWLTQSQCDRLIRVAPDGTVATVPAEGLLNQIAPAADGAVWFSSSDGVERATAGGRVTLAAAARVLTLVASPDGSAWYSNYDDCAIYNVNSAGHRTTYPSPVLPLHLALAADGAVWIASDTALVQTSTSGLRNGPRCVARYPHSKTSPNPGASTVTLRALRRGYLVTPSVPGRLDATIFIDDVTAPRSAPPTVSAAAVVAKGHHRVRLRIPKATLEKLAKLLRRGDRIKVSAYIRIYDRDGNFAFANDSVLVRAARLRP